MSQWPNPFDCPELTPHQQQVAATALSRRVAVITGGPGVGKSWLTAAIIRRIIAEHGVSSIAVSGPTGKSAVRINELLRAAGIEDLTATTTHRMLGIDRMGYDGGGWTFQHNERNPLPFRFVFTEEIGNMDIDMAASLFRAMAPGTHWLGSGDSGQLPSVGHGGFLRDILDSGRVPFGELTEIHRNGGVIARGCQMIRAGIQFPAPTTINLANGDNWKHYEIASPTRQIQQLEQFLSSLPAHIDPIWDTQVLCAVNKKSPLARETLNERLQQILNPNGKQVSGQPFRVADKVICRENTMFPIFEADGVKEAVANGEFGKVLDVDPKKMIVQFDFPKRVCIIPMASQKSEDGDTEKTGSRKGFQLGYAATTHLMQGSQAKVVIPMFDEYGGAMRLVSREHHYTSVSRAESLCATIGKWSVFQTQCKRVVLRDRKTFLTEQLRELIPAKSATAKAVPA